MSFYQITHQLPNGFTAVHAIGRIGQYAMYDPAGRFYTYARSLKEARELAKKFVERLASQ
jgi:hypothetical protein